MIFCARSTRGLRRIGMGAPCQERKNKQAWGEDGTIVDQAGELTGSCIWKRSLIMMCAQ
jgi:hypothetical protein